MLTKNTTSAKTDGGSLSQDYAAAAEEAAMAAAQWQSEIKNLEVRHREASA